MAKIHYRNFSKEDIQFLIRSRLKQKVRNKKKNKFVQMDLFVDPVKTLSNNQKK